MVPKCLHRSSRIAPEWKGQAVYNESTVTAILNLHDSWVEMGHIRMHVYLLLYVFQIYKKPNTFLMGKKSNKNGTAQKFIPIILMRF